ncbi:AAA family ATPase [Chitinophaga sp. Hz27]|uniref:AAA family ATPase n=1 Tax=Chitinophaga sp. Hz27 TaxID=3347169 RepID=UPI0035E38FAB
MKTKKIVPQVWAMSETIAFNTLVAYFLDAQAYGNVFAVTGNAGCGKTFAARWFAGEHKAVYHLECAEYWNRKTFLEKLLQAMGEQQPGGNVAEMMEATVDALFQQETPLLIIDEADKLSDQVLYFFISFYNLLKGHCGIILMATPHLAQRIERGRRLKKKGYAEIFSRIGRRFIPLSAVSKKELTAICVANNISDEAIIAAVYHDCEGDLRRLEREIHKRRRKNSPQQN